MPLRQIISKRSTVQFETAVKLDKLGILYTFHRFSKELINIYKSSEKMVVSSYSM